MNDTTDRLLRAIEADDLAAARDILRHEPALARHTVAAPQLFTGKIQHWLYAGDTILHFAAAGYRAEIVRHLLERGADPNSYENHRRSGPLHYAADGHPEAGPNAEKKQVETIKCLLKAGAKINAQDKNGAAPLHRAVRTRSAAATRFLLDAGADPSLRNKPGSTAFHLAVQNTGRGGSGSDPAKAAQREIIREFLSRGLSVTLRDGNGKSVLECARADWIREMLSA